MIVTTLLRLDTDRTVPITITPSANGGSEWEPVTIDGMAARIWLAENDLQCGKGDVSNAQERERNHGAR